LGVVPYPDGMSIEFLLKFRDNTVREISHCVSFFSGD
jgi:hypothetical protein